MEESSRDQGRQMALATASTLRHLVGSDGHLSYDGPALARLNAPVAAWSTRAPMTVPLVPAAVVTIAVWLAQGVRRLRVH